MLENKTIEFKREYTDDIKYAVIAFANTDGGKVYIGMNDDGSVIGVDDCDDTMLRVTNMVRDAVRPDVTMFMDCNIEMIDEKMVVVLSVQRGTSRPYYLHKKGVRPEGVYVRQGASSVPASETAILNMIKETSGDRYETALSLNQQLTFDKCTSYFKEKNIEFGDNQMRSLNLVGEDGTFTNLGMLLSDQCTHTIKIAVFEGSTKTVFKDRCELSGSLFEQMEAAYAFIDKYNRTRSEFEGLYRIDRKDYPVEALREALLNAIVHREYAISAPTLISIFDDRIEITTLGGLVRGISFDDIMLGISVLRNQYLAQIFYRLKLIEAYGTGMMKIQECYVDYAVKPKIEVSNNAFKITLPNLNFYAEQKNHNQVQEHRTSYGMRQESKEQKVHRYDTREERILQLFEDTATISRKDIEDALQVSQATAVLIIRELVNKGTLEKVGGGKYLRYRLGKGK